MPKTIKVKVYQFSELEGKAKERAMDWYREGLDYPWYDFTKEDFEGILKKAGFENVQSWFSGFCSQGDGACFDFKGLDIKALLAFKDDENAKPYSDIIEAWKESNKDTLRNIKRFQNVLYCKSEKTSFANHYSHSKTRFASVELDDYGHQNGNKTAEKFTELFEKALDELMQDLSNKYYKLLNDDWDYINSEESIKEGMESNEYTFTLDGKRFG
jgi:hypothetical protein